jgi:hypothetical protein
MLSHTPSGRKSTGGLVFNSAKVEASQGIQRPAIVIQGFGDASR